MNRRFSPFLKMEDAGKRGPLLWLLVHLSVPALLLASLFFVGRVRINTSLFDMLPKTGGSKAVMEADARLAEKTGRELVILCAAPVFEEAKKAAALLLGEFEKSAYFNTDAIMPGDGVRSAVLYFDSKLIEDFYWYLYDYRFVIAGNDTLDLLESGRAENIAEDALASAFGAFNLLPLDTIENDPFLLAERRMEEFLASPLLSVGTMSIKEDVLAAEKDGNWHVLLRLTLAPQAVSVRANNNVIASIYSAASAIKESMPGVEFYFSGVSFHSYESSSGAQKEITLIGIITAIMILLLFLTIFRTPLPVLFSITAVGFSLGLATAAALLVFREMHIITFVFGTTLIGTCVDYSVHFFVHWKGNPALKDGAEIRSHIKKSILMSFISTEICFFVFIFAPFPILKQFAVFSMAGLLSSFLTCFCVYPRLKLPPAEKRMFPQNLKNNKPRSYTEFLIRKSSFLRFLLRHWKAVLFTGMVFAILTLLITHASFIKIENNLSSLYTMSPSMMESEKRAAQVLGYGSSGWYFIVSGTSKEETLENEEKLLDRLREEIDRGNLESFLGTSVFAPSIKTQKRTYEAMKALLPLAPAQFDFLGFPPEYAQSFEKEFAAAERRYSVPNALPSFFGVSNLWIGEQGGSWYSCVLPVKPADEKIFRAIAEEIEDVHFINKAKDIGRDLDTLTKTMLILFLAAYLGIAVLVCFMYPLKDSLKICLIPLLLAAAALAVLAANRIPLGFFSAAALVLVFGLGLDYVFYMTGRKKDNLALLGVVLSFLTTLFSFGALAFSGFMPVHIFGLTVSAGLGAAFISAIILQARHN